MTGDNSFAYPVEACPIRLFFFFFFFSGVEKKFLLFPSLCPSPKIKRLSFFSPPPPPPPQPTPEILLTPVVLLAKGMDSSLFLYQRGIRPCSFPFFSGVLPYPAGAGHALSLFFFFRLLCRMIDDPIFFFPDVSLPRFEEKAAFFFLLRIVLRRSGLSLSYILPLLGKGWRRFFFFWVGLFFPSRFPRLCDQSDSGPFFFFSSRGRRCCREVLGIARGVFLPPP